MKTRTSALMPVLAALTLTAGCSDLQGDALLAQAAATETAYVNGRIYTQDEDRPWAESLVTKGDRIVFVGSDEEALEHAAEDARLVDLQHRFVMPGMVDAHTHPGLIATGANLSVLDETDEADEGPAKADRMPSRPREATLAWLQRYADDHPFTLVIRQGVWDVATYLPHGPHKSDLDAISRLRPIMLNDNSGHSVWVNSAFLRLFGIDADTPDLSRNLSHFVRDENGEPTGWVKEFSLLPYFGDRFVPDADELKERLLKYLNYMSSRGITTLWDAGNFNMDDAVYQAAHDIAREGNLPLRWEGSHHIFPASFVHPFQRPVKPSTFKVPYSVAGEERHDPGSSVVIQCIREHLQLQHVVGHLLLAASKVAAIEQTDFHVITLHPVPEAPHFRRD